jgi:hypothetical protein
MTAHTASVIGYAVSGIGTVFLFLDSLRISKRLAPSGTLMEDYGIHLRWFFRWASPIGFGALFIGFAFQFASLFL